MCSRNPPNTRGSTFPIRNPLCNEMVVVLIRFLQVQGQNPNRPAAHNVTELLCPFSAADSNLRSAGQS